MPNTSPISAWQHDRSIPEDVGVSAGQLRSATAGRP
jgi:hypothetical protein